MMVSSLLITNWGVIMRFFIFIAILLLSGCAGFADTASKMAGMGVIKESKNLFDNATVVEVTPAFLFNPDNVISANNVKLGAIWISSDPQNIGLVFSYDSSTMRSGMPIFIGISGVDINIDGKIQSFKAGTTTSMGSSGYNTSSRAAYTQSANTVIVPFNVVKQMTLGKRTLLRVYTSKGFEDSDFTVERYAGGQGTAILSIKEFLLKVEAIRLQATTTK
jgi:hypothetical protein